MILGKGIFVNNGNWFRQKIAYLLLPRGWMSILLNKMDTRLRGYDNSDFGN